MAAATITTKGQITIPKAIRDSLMLSAGDKIESTVSVHTDRVRRPSSLRSGLKKAANFIGPQPYRRKG